MEFEFPLGLHPVYYVMMYVNVVQNFLCRPVGDESLTPLAERDAHQKHVDCRKRRLQFPGPILKVEITCGKESGQDDEPTSSRQTLRELVPHPNFNHLHIVLQLVDRSSAREFSILMDD